jgi:hypothetical protein
MVKKRATGIIKVSASALIALTLILILLGLGGCRKEEPTETPAAYVPYEVESAANAYGYAFYSIARAFESSESAELDITLDYNGFAGEPAAVIMKYMGVTAFLGNEDVPCYYSGTAHYGNNYALKADMEFQQFIEIYLYVLNNDLCWDYILCADSYSLLDNESGGRTLTADCSINGDSQTFEVNTTADDVFLSATLTSVKNSSTVTIQLDMEEIGATINVPAPEMFPSGATDMTETAASIKEIRENMLDSYAGYTMSSVVFYAAEGNLYSATGDQFYMKDGKVSYVKASGESTYYADNTVYNHNENTDYYDAKVYLDYNLNAIKYSFINESLQTFLRLEYSVQKTTDGMITLYSGTTRSYAISDGVMDYWTYTTASGGKFKYDFSLNSVDITVPEDLDAYISYDKATDLYYSCHMLDKSNEFLLKYFTENGSDPSLTDYRNGLSTLELELTETAPNIAEMTEYVYYLVLIPSVGETAGNIDSVYYSGLTGIYKVFYSEGEISYEELSEN